jgi:hypothetical protein
MDVDNRALDDGGGGTDGDDGFAEGRDGLTAEASDDVVQDAGSADAQADSTDGMMDEETQGEEQLGASQASDDSGDTNLPDDVFEIDPSPHSLLSVLFPAKPPRPRNARIVRLFDLEAAKNDPEPGEAPVVEQQPKEEPRTREAIRAARNQSLLTAARLR